MNMLEAVKQVKADCIEGIRGVGTMAIVMADGRKYYVVHAHDPEMLVECITEDGDLLHRVPAADVQGEVDHITGTTDSLGGIYID